MKESAGRLPLLEERILLHELNHRVNNEFTTAISFLSLAATRSHDDRVKTTLSEAAGLLRRYADVHRVLQMPDDDTTIDAAAYLHQLCRSITQSQLDPRRIELILDTQSLWLSAHRCWLLGMIVFELVNNAARHAFSGGEGRIRVELLAADAVVECRVMDNGSFAANVQPGRGLKIIEELSKSLGGQLNQAFGPLGSNSILVFPCEGDTRTAAERRGNGSDLVEDKVPPPSRRQIGMHVSRRNAADRPLTRGGTGHGASHSRLRVDR